LSTTGTPIVNVPARTPMYNDAKGQPVDGGTLSRTWFLFFEGLRSAGSGGGGAQLQIEIPAGLMNGTNVTFVLSKKVGSSPLPWLALFLNGVYQEPSNPDYVLAADSITITMTVPPKANDYALFALYLVA